jgi:D-alanyl-D-alanine carboxypeptidase/D-alanyl-D-alanine-endopeptidase (penicillin-binding protein 4)
MDLKAILRNFLFLGLILLLIHGFTACKVLDIHMGEAKALENKYLKNKVFSDAFTGFVLYDPVQDQSVIEINSHKAFTPASNTKILTLLDAIEQTGDSLPLISYSAERDTLYFKGTGNPLNLNPAFKDNRQLISWLSQFEGKTLIYVPSRPVPERFGSGWAWDDYLYSYQLENHALPVYGNQLLVKGTIQNPTIIPAALTTHVSFIPAAKFNVNRAFDSNDYLIHHNIESVDLKLPLHMTDRLVVDILSQELDRQITICSDPGINLEWNYLRIPFPDSLYIEMMQQSDNFIAEQLLLTSSGIGTDTMRREMAIRDALNRWEPFLRDTIRWVDGSGLSRYNLLTPYTVVQLLEKIYDLKSFDWIKKVFAQGGISGTIESWYFPWVYAKTGTLSNNHNLSGFIETKRGRVLIFSFMHNHYLRPSSDYKTEMEKFLQDIHDRF